MAHLFQNIDDQSDESDTTESSTAEATNNEAMNEDAADVTQTEEEDLGKVEHYHDLQYIGFST